MRTLDRPVDYLNPHATSTPIGDAKEMEAVRDAFGDRLPLISSTKSLTGHSLGAAGVQEAIYSILMMNQGFVCESAHIDEIDPAFADLPIVRKRTDARIDCVLSNSFGFGGTNASLAFIKLAA
jgi:3-oxoacyl-[acyl-carrier-protein] synthase-1